MKKGSEEEEEGKKRSRRLLTRILSPEQLRRLNIGTRTTRRSQRSLERNLPESIDPRGGGQNDMSRLYMYMRRFGGAGYLGFHKETKGRHAIARQILERMRAHREKTMGSESRRRKPYKFAMISIDPDRLNSPVLDLGSSKIQKRFHKNYYKYRRMYKRHADEGVVVVDGKVPRSAIVSLRAFRLTRDIEDEEDMLALIEQLIADEEESIDIDLPDDKKDNNGPPPPPSMGGAQLIQVN